MIDLAELISRVRTRYEQSSSTRWTDEEITHSINEALESLAEETHFYERNCTLPIQLNRTWYDIRGFTPETPLEIRSIWSTSRDQWLTPVDETDLQFQWENSTGDPTMYFTRGIYWLGLWPKAGTATNTDGFLRVFFAAIPSRWTHTQEVLSDLPKNYMPAVVDYSLYDLASKDREPQKAIEHFRNYLRREKELKMRMDHRIAGAQAGAIGQYGGD